ncbi:MAG: T9SS type A sorting domain-containing protein [Candidatus Woesearchaeota archaeon]|nr:MAG: T9SS type A sorting domain-containing protein [Candidatus Woesearchaeota archaeon]
MVKKDSLLTRINTAAKILLLGATLGQPAFAQGVGTTPDLSIRAQGGDVLLNWTRVDRARDYHVDKASHDPHNPNNFLPLATTADTFLTDVGAVGNGQGWYRVSARTDPDTLLINMLSIPNQELLTNPSQGFIPVPDFSVDLINSATGDTTHYTSDADGFLRIPLDEDTGVPQQRNNTHLDFDYFSATGLTQATIYDVLGRRVANIKSMDEINTLGLSSGKYFIQGTDSPFAEGITVAHGQVLEGYKNWNKAAKQARTLGTRLVPANAQSTIEQDGETRDERTGEAININDYFRMNVDTPDQSVFPNINAVLTRPDIGMWWANNGTDVSDHITSNDTTSTIVANYPQGNGSWSLNEYFGQPFRFINDDHPDDRFATIFVKRTEGLRGSAEDHNNYNAWGSHLRAIFMIGPDWQRWMYPINWDNGQELTAEQLLTYYNFHEQVVPGFFAIGQDTLRQYASELTATTELPNEVGSRYKNWMWFDSGAPNGNANSANPDDIWADYLVRSEQSFNIGEPSPVRAQEFAESAGLLGGADIDQMDDDFGYSTVGDIYVTDGTGGPGWVLRSMMAYRNLAGRQLRQSDLGQAQMPGLQATETRESRFSSTGPSIEELTEQGKTIKVSELKAYVATHPEAAQQPVSQVINAYNNK